MDHMSAALEIVDFRDDLADAFYRINAQWIAEHYELEATDIDVMANPRERIVDRGGAVLFVAHPTLGVVGTCALQKTGERQFELIKMGVTSEARGLGAGVALLAAAIERADRLGCDRLYLLSNAKAATAMRLYERAGFVHDAGIMAEFGARYARCDVAMLYRPQAG